MDKLPDSEVVAAARRHDVESKIFDGTASKGEVRDWYFSLDPLRDDYYDLAHNDVAVDDSEQALLQHNLDYSMSQIALFGSAAQILSEDKLHTFKFYLPINRPPAGKKSDKPENKYSEHQSFSIKNIKDPESVNELNIAQDCFSRANMYCLDMLRVLDASEGNNELKASITGLQMHYDRKSIDAVKTITSLTMGWAITGAEELKPSNETLDSVFYAHKQWLSSQFYEAAVDKEFTSLKAAFGNTITTIEELVTEPAERAGIKVIKDPVSKGHLHELLWLLDANFTLSSQYENRGPCAVAAPLGFDRPEINHPVLKRAYDMILVGHKARIPVQLKSGNNSAAKNQYNKKIYIAKETNFQDVDLRRLASRLKDYKGWLDSDLNDVSLANKILSRRLPSVVSALEMFQEIENDDRHLPRVTKFIGNRGIDFLSNTHPLFKPKRQ